MHLCILLCNDDLVLIHLCILLCNNVLVFMHLCILSCIMYFLLLCIQAIVEEQTRALRLVADCRRTVEKLSKFCDAAAMTEIEKYTEDMEQLREEVEDSVKERKDVLRTALERAHNYAAYYKVVGVSIYLPLFS